MEDLTPLDFFSPQGMIGHARNEKNAKISSEKASYLGHRIRIIRLIYERAPDKYLWLLWIDPHSDLILRAEQTGYLRISRWGLKQKVIFDHFDYNVPVHDSLFQLPARHSPSGKYGLVRSSAKRGVGATARAHRKPGR